MFKSTLNFSFNIKNFLSRIILSSASKISNLKFPEILKLTSLFGSDNL